MNINTKYELGDNEGSSTQTNNKFIVLHETTNIGAEANAKYFKNNWSSTQTYVQYVIGDGGKIFKVGADGYQAWGAGSYANANSPVQIELARTADKATFKKDYEAFVNFSRAKAKEFGIPTVLDEGGQYDNGVKTHKWISEHIWGSHTDPVESYLEPFWGITHEQLASDIANGIAEIEVKPAKTFNDIYNIVTALNENIKGYTTYNSKGVADDKTNIAPDTGWISSAVKVMNGKAYFKIATDMYLPQSSTTFKGKVVINYLKDYGVLAYHANGDSIADSNKTFKGGSEWAYDKIEDIPNVGYAYRVATDTYIPTKYQQGSGFKG